MKDNRQSDNDSQESTGKLYDLDVAYERMGQDATLLGEVIDVFLEDYVVTLHGLDRASAQKDFQKIQLAAHTLKGATANFAAETVTDLAFEVEQACQARRIETAQAKAMELKKQVTKLAEALRTYRTKKAA